MAGLDPSEGVGATERADVAAGVVSAVPPCRTDRGQKAEYHGQKILDCYPVRRWGTDKEGKMTEAAG
jgi:hypothetical protein